MKVCRKCKRHVVNKAKICKYCGCDVSKAKIIKNSSATPRKKSNSIVNNVNKVNVVNKSNISFDDKKKVDKIDKFDLKDKVVNKKDKIFGNKKFDVKKKKFSKVELLKIKLPKVSFPKMSFSRIKLSKIDFKKIKLPSINFKKSLCSFRNKFSFNKGKKKVSVFNKDLFVKRGKSVLDSILSFCKRICFGVKNSVIRFVKFVRLDRVSVLFTWFYNGIKKCLLCLRSIRFANSKFSFKVLLIIVLSLVVVGTCSYFGVDAYKDRDNNDSEVVIGEKATTDKIFSMGDLITYDGVDYKVMKVRTSKGNYYKTPKEGHEFVIVTVYIKNNTGDKIPYSYVNWTMSNSVNEEKDVMFTSINTNDALYSGELVIGGIKIGSMVFEQPIKDSKLRLNFYDLMKDDNGEDTIDYSKKRFSVSIKIPEKTDQNNNGNTSSDVKAVKTSDDSNN